MTDTQVQATPIVQVPIFGEDSKFILFATLAENTAHDPATISNDDLIALVVTSLDLQDVDALKRRMMGPHYSVDRELKVTRPSTGNILLAMSAELG